MNINLFGEEVSLTKAKQREETPLMRQYHEIKKKYDGALILFRVGDFYETFGEDAIKASKILGITLTKRGNGAASEIELAGFPHHSLETYLPKLVAANCRVAICDQLEDPKLAKGLVKRGVTELVTPGVVMNDTVLKSNKNNYLCSIFNHDQTYGIAFLDISTGEFSLTQGTYEAIDKLIHSYNPSEIIYTKSQKNLFLGILSEVGATYALEDWVYRIDYANELINTQFNTQSIKGFGIDSLEIGVIAAGAILYYLKATEHLQTSHITQIARIDEGQHVWMDRFTIRNLELLYPQTEGGNPLVDVLDRTLTPMGARLLRRWIIQPLKDKDEIQKRLSQVEYLYNQQELNQALGLLLKEVGDLERLMSKLASKRINPRELNALKRSLITVQKIKKTILEHAKQKDLLKKANLLNDCSFLTEQINAILKTDAGILTNQGNLINDGINTELDELRQIKNNGKDFLVKIANREIERTSIPSLKIQFNKVFGYYLEVTNAHKNKVPSDWIRKQTTTNSERYITEELKQYEEKILNAEEKIIAIEQKIYNELVITSCDYISFIQQNAKLIAEIDTLLNFANIAKQNNYHKPIFTDGLEINIKAGRHPVIEQNLGPDNQYVPNDVYLDKDTQQIIIITGPNMAGKSALLRQTALIVLMAQMGSFVPADHLELGIVDKIFTRVGASDNLSKGESTFMVEMTETASILNNISDRSLILMDEIGRGTSTYDGISIAWSIVEYLHQNPKAKPKTLFATHYHELNELEGKFDRVKNYNVSIKEAGDKIIFLRKLIKGGAEHSFGIHVAQMAGIPLPIVLRASEIMQQLEQKAEDRDTRKKLTSNSNNKQKIYTNNELDTLLLQQIKQVLDKIDINTITPIDALFKLNELKNILK